MSARVDGGNNLYHAPVTVPVHLSMYIVSVCFGTDPPNLSMYIAGTRRECAHFKRYNC